MHKIDETEDDMDLPIIARSLKGRGAKVWIDLDNSPHVPFFRPIIKELDKKGYQVLVTARDNAQTCELADKYSMSYIKIGKHYGKNKIIKVIFTIIRASRLILLMKKQRPILAIGHGSRAQVLASKILKIPSLGISDYEFTSGLGGPDWILSPEILASTAARTRGKSRIGYPGIKEYVYVPYFKPDLKLREAMGFHQDDILVTMRPPATEAHYHNPESEILFSTAVERLKSMDHVKIVILPRYRRQKEDIQKMWPEDIACRKIVIPNEAIDGLNLLWNSDLIISGGGTMNREAAALRVPVYSIFRGKIGAVDKWLNGQGRLEFIETTQDVYKKIAVVKREITSSIAESFPETLSFIVNYIEKLINENYEAKGNRDD